MTCLGILTMIIGAVQCILYSFGIVILAVILNVQDMDPESRKAVGFGIGCACFFLILNVLLIYGAEQRKRWFVIPWILVSGVGCLVGTVFLIINYCHLNMAACALGWAQLIPVICFYIELHQTNVSESIEPRYGMTVSSPLQEPKIFVAHDKSLQVA